MACIVLMQPLDAQFLEILGLMEGGPKMLAVIEFCDRVEWRAVAGLTSWVQEDGHRTV